MGKYCLLEKCGCEDAIYMDGHDSLYCRFGQRLYKISDLKECPGSSRQQPVEIRGDFAAQSYEKEIAAEIATMPDDEIAANLEGVKKMCQQAVEAEEIDTSPNGGVDAGYIIGYNAAIDEAVGTVKELLDENFYAIAELAFKQAIAAITALKK